MKEITFQTHACAVSPSSKEEMSCMTLTASGARYRSACLPQRIFYVVRCGGPQHPPCVKGVTCWVTNDIITKVGCLNLSEPIPQPVNEQKWFYDGGWWRDSPANTKLAPALVSLHIFYFFFKCELDHKVSSGRLWSCPRAFLLKVLHSQGKRFQGV